ncbi:MAG: hypothetical protein FJW31_15655 [Acidobacteria bacterium]|nr:hypothetical protein [Acidobacteriota bacterium]
MLQGASIKATIDARYFYGEPVAKAKVKYVVHKSRYWVPWDTEDLEDEPAEGEGDSEYTQREQVMEEEGELDDDGKLEIEVPAGEADHDLQYRIEGRVTDATGREISGAGFVTATVGPYFLRVQADKCLYAPGDTVKVSVTTRDYDNKAAANVAFQAELVNYHWRDADNAGRVISSAQGTTSATGEGVAELKLLNHGGSFRVRITSRTPGGRQVRDLEYL